MAYAETEWVPKKTEFTADRMNNIEAGIAAKAEKGDPGKQGNPGKQGDPGKDGAPSQEDWDKLVSRVEALEEAAE